MSGPPPTGGVQRTSVATFEAEPRCAGMARRFVVGAAREWGLHSVLDDAALCSAELATNAILHSRAEFTVAVRRTPVGVRIDVHDDRPDRLPVVVPTTFEPLETGMTGRGLMLVASVADRWGYFTTPVAKTVWLELSGSQPTAPTAPIVELAHRPADSALAVVEIIDLPVRAAVASGIQVDELVRELQLQPDRLSDSDRARLHDLLERSAGPRLVGRQEAYRAAAAGDTHYTFKLATDRAEMHAVGELRDFLDRLRDESSLDAREVGPDVAAMRAWLSSEVAAQLSGSAPSAYPHA